MIKVHEALWSLGKKNYVLYGDPSNEQEFLDSYKTTTTGENNIGIQSSDASLFGVTWSEIQAELIRLEKAHSDNEYARNRATAYPSIGDQLDMQYHDQIDGTTTWKDAIAKVKSDNPKE
jgi:hypothetical protein